MCLVVAREYITCTSREHFQRVQFASSGEAQTRMQTFSYRAAAPKNVNYRDF